MDPFTVGLIGIGVLFILLFLKLPIGIAMALVGAGGFTYLVGIEPGLSKLMTTPYLTFTAYYMSVVPLFLLMGSFMFFTGISRDLYWTVYRWLGHLPGGLAMATVGGCAAFAAVSGSSTATSVAMGTIGLPEMKRYKYDDRLATGAIAAGGTIGILIPPSITLVIYGIITEQSIGKLFLAGFFPGILEAVFYIVTIYIITKHNPTLGPRGPQTNLKEKVVSLKDVWPVVVIFMLVMGGIYLGVTTPTEAGAVGAFGALIFAVSKRKLNWQLFNTALHEAGKMTAMIFLIVLGAFFFTYFLAVSNLPRELANFISELEINRYIIMAGIMVMYIAMGTVMEGLSMILLTVPVLFPLLAVMGWDPIWYGIIIVRVLEIGMITPPVGINVFVIKGVAKDVPMYTIFRGIVPFLIADILHVTLLIAAPQVVLWLPSVAR